MEKMHRNHEAGIREARMYKARMHKAEMVHARRSGKSFAKAFMRGLFLGGALTAVAMFFLAPRSGKRSRAKIQRQYGELRDQLFESIENAEEEIVDNAHHAAAGLRHKVKELQRHQ